MSNNIYTLTQYARDKDYYYSMSLLIVSLGVGVFLTGLASDVCFRTTPDLLRADGAPNVKCGRLQAPAGTWPGRSGAGPVWPLARRLFCSRPPSSNPPFLPRVLLFGGPTPRGPAARSPAFDFQRGDLAALLSWRSDQEAEALKVGPSAPRSASPVRWLRDRSSRLFFGFLLLKLV